MIIPINGRGHFVNSNVALNIMQSPCGIRLVESFDFRHYVYNQHLETFSRSGPDCDINDMMSCGAEISTASMNCAEV